MKLAEIRNGLTFAGYTRKDNYEGRACAPKPKNTAVQPTYGQLSQAYKRACQIITAQDSFIKSNTAKKVQ